MADELVLNNKGPTVSGTLSSLNRLKVGSSGADYAPYLNSIYNAGLQLQETESDIISNTTNQWKDLATQSRQLFNLNPNASRTDMLEMTDALENTLGQFSSNTINNRAILQDNVQSWFRGVGDFFQDESVAKSVGADIFSGLSGNDRDKYESMNQLVEALESEDSLAYFDVFFDDNEIENISNAIQEDEDRTGIASESWLEAFTPDAYDKAERRHNRSQGFFSPVTTLFLGGDMSGGIISDITTIAHKLTVDTLNFLFVQPIQSPIAATVALFQGDWDKMAKELTETGLSIGNWFLILGTGGAALALEEGATLAAEEAVTIAGEAFLATEEGALLGAAEEAVLEAEAALAEANAAKAAAQEALGEGGVVAAELDEAIAEADALLKGHQTNLADLTAKKASYIEDAIKNKRLAGFGTIVSEEEALVSLEAEMAESAVVEDLEGEFAKSASGSSLGGGETPRVKIDEKKAAKINKRFEDKLAKRDKLEKLAAKKKVKLEDKIKTLEKRADSKIPGWSHFNRWRKSANSKKLAGVTTSKGNLGLLGKGKRALFNRYGDTNKAVGFAKTAAANLSIGASWSFVTDFIPALIEQQQDEDYNGLDVFINSLTDNILDE